MNNSTLLNISVYCQYKINPDLGVGSVILNLGWVFILLLLGHAFIYLLVAYLNNKPLGEQTLMDSCHKQLMGCLSMMSISFFVSICVTETFSDAGECWAFAAMWPCYTSINMFTASLLTNSIVQCALMTWPHLIEDSRILKLIKAGITGVMVVASIVLCLCGSKPEAYSHLRNLKYEYTSACTRFRSVFTTIALLVFVVLRFKVYLNTRKVSVGEGVPTRQVLSNQALVFVSAYWSFLIALRILIGDHNLVIAKLAIFGTGCILPAYAIFNKVEVKRQCLRKLRNTFGDFVLLRRNEIDPNVSALEMR